MINIKDTDILVYDLDILIVQCKKKTSSTQNTGKYERITMF